MIRQNTLLAQLADEFRQASDLGVEDVKVLPRHGMVTAQLPAMGGSPARFLVAVTKGEAFQVRVHNVAHTFPPLGTENVMARHFLESGPSHADDPQRLVTSLVKATLRPMP